MQCLLGEEGDTTAIERAQGLIVKNIEDLKNSRISGEPEVVPACSDIDDDCGGGFYGGY